MESKKLIETGNGIKGEYEVIDKFSMKIWMTEKKNIVFDTMVGHGRLERGCSVHKHSSRSLVNEESWKAWSCLHSAGSAAVRLWTGRNARECPVTDSGYHRRRTGNCLHGGRVRQILL